MLQSYVPRGSSLERQEIPLNGTMPEDAVWLDLINPVAGEDKILLVDVYSVDHDQAIEPAQYGLSNITTPACDSTKVGSSLLCSSAS